MAIKKELEALKRRIVCPHCGRRLGAPLENEKNADISRLSEPQLSNEIAERMTVLLNTAAGRMDPPKRVVMMDAGLYDELVKQKLMQEVSENEQSTGS
jgi:hypothetical protein